MPNATRATQKWKKDLQRLWPAAKGSLAKVYKPCIRPGCPACARGDKHPAWLLSVSRRGRRKVLYVPRALVPRIRQAIKNGRKLEQLLCRTAQDLVKDYRRSLKTASKARPKS